MNNLLTPVGDSFYGRVSHVGLSCTTPIGLFFSRARARRKLQCSELRRWANSARGAFPCADTPCVRYTLPPTVLLRRGRPPPRRRVCVLWIARLAPSEAGDTAFFISRLVQQIRVPLNSA